MKKLLLLITLFVIFSCTRESVNEEMINEGAKSRTERAWFASALPHGISPENGIRSTFDVVSLGGVSGNDAKAIWISVELTNGYWVQWGYHKTASTFRDFYFVYRYNVLQEVESTLLSNFLPPILGTKASYAIYNITGSTKWRLSKNGIDYMELELGATTALNGEVTIESNFSSNPPRFPKINLYPALERNVVGTWEPVTTARAGYMPAWGIEGIFQNTSLRQNELNMGSGINNIDSNVILF